MNMKTIIIIVVVVIALLIGIAIGGFALPGRVLTVTVTTPTTVITTMPTTKVVTETIAQTQTLTAVVEKISIVDVLGRSIEFEDVPRRIVSTMPSITEILFALGLGDRVVGVTTYCNYPPDVPRLVGEGKIEIVGDPWTLDIEKIVSLQPDLVLLDVSAHARLKGKFDELGLKTVFLKSNTAQNIYDIYSDIMLLAKIFRAEDRAQKLIDEMNLKFIDITSRLIDAAKPKMLYLAGPPSWGLYSAGGNTFIGWLIENTGGDNIAKQYIGWPQLDYEFILSQNPDIIIITAMNINPRDIYDEIAGTPLVETNAWKSGRVYLLSGEANDILSRPGPRVVEVLEILAHIVHPEIFGEIQRADVVNIAKLSVTPLPIQTAAISVDRIW